MPESWCRKAIGVGSVFNEIRTDTNSSSGAGQEPLSSCRARMIEWLGRRIAVPREFRPFESSRVCSIPAGVPDRVLVSLPHWQPGFCEWQVVPSSCPVATHQVRGRCILRGVATRIHASSNLCRRGFRRLGQSPWFRDDLRTIGRLGQSPWFRDDVRTIALVADPCDLAWLGGDIGVGGGCLGDEFQRNPERRGGRCRTGETDDLEDNEWSSLEHPRGRCRRPRTMGAAPVSVATGWSGREKRALWRGAPE